MHLQRAARDDEMLPRFRALVRACGAGAAEQRDQSDQEQPNLRLHGVPRVRSAPVSVRHYTRRFNLAAARGEHLGTVSRDSPSCRFRAFFRDAIATMSAVGSTRIPT